MSQSVAVPELWPLAVSPLSPRIGAEIEGVRLSGELPDATIEGIHAALLRHKVLFFRRHNHLTDDQQEIVLWSCPPSWARRCDSACDDGERTGSLQPGLYPAS